MVKRVIRRNVEIPTCTFKKEDIITLAGIFDNALHEYIGTLPEDFISEKRKYDESYLLPTYKAVFVNSRVEAYTYEEISDNWEEDLISIEMSFQKHRDNSIDIKFDFKTKSEYNNYISIVGENETWVLGTEQKILSFLNTCKNSHYILYGPARHLIRPVIGFFIVICLSYSLIFLANFFPSGLSEPSTKDSLDYVVAYLTILIISYSVGGITELTFIDKVFPKIEHYNPDNLKNKLLKGAGVILYLLSAITTIYTCIQLLASFI